MQGALTRLRSNLEHLGAGKTLLRSAYMVLNTVVTVRIFECMRMTRDDLNEETLETPMPYEARFLQAMEMRELARLPENNISDKLLSRALEKGDDCYAIFDGETLASFGWYTGRPTIVWDSHLLRFEPDFVYMYHGYTKPQYRGQKLHALGLAQALVHYVERGKDGFVTIAEAVNFKSKRSAYRIGFERFGLVFLLYAGTRCVTWHSRGCREQGLRFEPLASS